MLSKSKYIKGLQCEKRLWLDKHRPELKDELSGAQESLFAQGTSLGELAQQLFPGGMDATSEDYSRLGKSIQKTAEWIEEGVPVIYEAAFSAGGSYAAMDILVKEKKGWRAVEVKSSTSVKEYHINDAAVQYYVLTSAGLNIIDIEIMHINNQYVRKGELDIQQLFARESVLDQILPLQASIPANLEKFTRILKSKEMPDQKIGPHCSNPFPCDFMGHCWGHVPENNVFNITRIGAKAWELFNDGILEMDKIPEDYPLSYAQMLQVRKEETFDAAAVKGFLDKWEFPLYFFDFETIGPAVPLFDGTSPYKQFPFQYSLHILRSPDDDEPEHREFLPEPVEDPRRALTEQMLLDLGQSGSIVTYNMSFEKGKIALLQDEFPEHAEALQNINDRIVDLIVPFRKRWCYKPEMNGSASIKFVLPSLVPELSYSNLEIKEGGTASSVYQAMLEGTFQGEIKTTMQHLREYCKLDTLAMVEIWKWLKSEIKAEI